MFTVGRDISISNDSTQLTSCTQALTPSDRLPVASSIRFAASAIIAFSAADQRPSLVGEAGDRRSVPVFRDQGVQRLHEVPGGAVDACLLARGVRAKTLRVATNESE
jgi:hypothetical protein